MIDIDLITSISCVVGAAYEKKPTFPASSGVQTGEARARATVNHARVGDLTVPLGCRARRAPTGACAVVQKGTVTSRRAPLRPAPRRTGVRRARRGTCFVSSTAKTYGVPQKRCSNPKKRRLAGFRDLTSKTSIFEPLVRYRLGESRPN